MEPSASVGKDTYTFSAVSLPVLPVLVSACILSDHEYCYVCNTLLCFTADTYTSALWTYFFVSHAKSILQWILLLNFPSSSALLIGWPLSMLFVHVFLVLAGFWAAFDKTSWQPVVSV